MTKKENSFVQPTDLWPTVDFDHTNNRPQAITVDFYYTFSRSETLTVDFFHTTNRYPIFFSLGIYNPHAYAFAF